MIFLDDKKEKLFQINIGKKGLNDNVLKEILRQIKLRKKIKVKFLKNIVDVKDKEELKSYFDNIFFYLNENINKEEEYKNFKVFKEKIKGFTIIFCLERVSE